MPPLMKWVGLCERELSALSSLSLIVGEVFESGFLSEVTFILDAVTPLGVRLMEQALFSRHSLCYLKRVFSENVLW